jgi:serine/threonine protein phosphatase PrpC
MELDFHIVTNNEDTELHPIQFTNGNGEYYSIKSLYEKPNQDGLCLISIKDKLRLILVADGMGGHSGASKVAGVIFDSFKKVFSKAKDANPKDLRALVLDSFELADQNVKDLKVGAGSTLTAIEVQDDFARFYNCGDSSSYLFGGRGKLKFKTLEHSPLGFGKESGLIEDSDNEDNIPVEGNIVSNGIGFDSMWVEVSVKVPHSHNDIILSSSDGMTKNYTLNDLTQLTTEGNFDERGKRLLENTMQKKDIFLQDDNTVVMFKINSETKG